MINLDEYNKFKILAIVNLENYFTLGKTWLYSTVKELHKQIFEDNERIIFYLDCPDIFEYDSEKGEIEENLDKFLQEIDIPNYFVIKLFQKEKNVATYDDTKCILPWMHLHLTPVGNITPCCFINQPFNNLKNCSNINDALNSDQFKKLRQSMLANKKPTACISCYEEEKLNMQSMRLNARDAYKKYEYLFGETNEDGSVTNIKIRDANIALDNVCNFKCRTCSRELSVLIEQEELAIGLINEPLVKNKNLENFNTFLDDFKSQIQDLESIHFFGGEPLFIDEHYHILDLLISNQKLNVNLLYHTNLSILNYKQKNIIDYWKKFPNLTIFISLDATGKKAEYVRYGTNWDKILKNINEIKNHLPNINLKIASTVSIYNCTHITELHKELIEKSIVTSDKINVSYAHSDLNDLRMLPQDIKQLVNLKIQNFMLQLQEYNNSTNLIKQYKSIIDYMLSEDRSYLLESFLEKVKKIDIHRKQNLFEVFPELSSIKKNNA